MRDGVSAAGSKREAIKRLWKAFFADPSQWWDYRLFKRNPKAPDFQHKATQDKLFLDGTRNPTWVHTLLAKKDKECPSITVPTPMLERDKKGKLQRVPRPVPSITMEGSIFNQRKKFITEEPTMNQINKMLVPTVEDPEPKQTKKMQISSSDISPCRTDTLVGKSKKVKKSYIIGEVCDWHTLSLEDSILALEKGSFAEPTIQTLVYIVYKCMKKKDRDYALRLLTYLQRNELDFHKDLGNYVVSMLVDVDRMQEAQVVFDKLAVRAECTWNALIMGYIKSGESQQAFDLYKIMRRDRTLHLSGYTVVALLKACTELKAVKVGRLLHADAAREGLLKTNTFVGNALLDMYGKCGSLSEARDVFEVLPAPNVITWTSLIAGYVQHEHGTAALKCFQLMQDSGVSPNAFTFSSVLKACGSLKNSVLGIEVHAKVEQEGLLKTSQIVGNALVDMYAKCGLLTKAREVFDILPARDVVSWNALITGYTEHAHFGEAISCFNNMLEAGVSPNGITFASCLKACANARAIEKGKEIHLKIAARGLLKKDPILGSSLVDMYAKCGLLEKAKEVFCKLSVQDAVAWTSLIAGYTQHDACEKALSCFKQMRAKCVSPDAIAYACGLKACSSVGATSMGAELYNEIEGKGLLEKKPPLGNAVVDMYSKFGMLAKAHEVFLAIPVHDVVAWTALLTGYAQLGDIKKVFYIFDKMREKGVNPTTVTVLGILHACSNAGLVDTAMGQIEVMSEEYGITQALEHYTCVIDLLGRIGQIKQGAALAFNSPFHPNVVMWMTLLGACQKWDHVWLARVAFEQVMLLEVSEASAYICMSNIHADAGRHEKSACSSENTQECKALQPRHETAVTC